jgi:hypothetical protein
MDAKRIDFDALPWESPARGARFKVFRGGGKKVRVVEFTREFVEPDWCEKGHIGFVLKGELEVDFDGQLVRSSSRQIRTMGTRHTLLRSGSPGKSRCLQERLFNGWWKIH